MNAKERNKMVIKTDCGELTVQEYDDGIANGVQIFLNDTIVAMVDCYRKASDDDLPEARLLVYGPEGPDFDEPQETIRIN